LSSDHPLVSIVTPVHNGETYLAECIESVLAQSYRNWEYLIVDNRSSDRTREIAGKYVVSDARIRVHACEEFVGVIESHNRAFRLISPSSKYCKVVSADDWIYPECVARMVECAEANPSAGFVGSYQLSGGGKDWCVRWTGLPYQSTVVPGRDICRATLLGGPYVFGVPTSTLYRSDLVRSRDSFYPGLRPYADVSAYFEYLQDTDFGFVHQVLSYERIHESALSTGHRSINTQAADILLGLIEYGPKYLTETEYDARLKDYRDNYYRVLATGLLNRRSREFWSYHKGIIRGLGYPLYGWRLAKALGLKLLDLSLNPKQTIERLLKRMN
jgi:glycosyltransferase involved in cell wall biosynthesis